MTGQSLHDQTNFRRILRRNIVFPVILGFFSAAVFLGLILYLLSVLAWVDHSERVIGAATEIGKLASDEETGVRGFLITGDEAFLAPYNIGHAKLSTELSDLMAMVSDNPPQVERLERIRALQNQWDIFAQQMIDLRRHNGDYQDAIRSGRGKVETDEVRRELGDFFEVEFRLRQERNLDAHSVTTVTVATFLLLSLGISGLLALFGRRELMRLSQTYSAALEQQRQHAEALAEQGWLRAGQSELAEQSIGQLALTPLGRAILEFLAGRLGVMVGAMYVREADGTLRRFASYGFSQESEQVNQSFAGNEGLVGQSAAENRLIRLDSVPEDYVKVTSGLGEAPPRHLVMVPLANDGRVNGVLELGFVRPIADRDIEFLLLVADNIGASIEGALYRQRLQDILAETQQLNEELQVQQEELRTANEELEAQSRILEESQVSLENQKAELEQTNEQLADQAVTLDQKNIALNQIQIELEERARDLQRASQYKSEFLANMSHELRTPLNSSLILAKLLSENPTGNLSDEQVKFAQTIYSAGNDLLNLINDILDISKVEAGKLELAPDDLNLGKLADSLRQTFEPLAVQKNLALTVEVDAGAPQSIFSDRQRLEQILKNLLSNAIKFTETGKIALTIARSGAHAVSFAVRDSGIGIVSDQQDIIFEAFRQADGTTSRRYGGTGLGLSISRDLAALLGGSITVSSEPGEGSTFTLILPQHWSERASSVDVAASAGVVASAGSPAPTPARTTFATSTASATPTAPAAAHAKSAASEYTLGAPAFPDDRDTDLSTARTVLVIEDESGFAQILYELAHEMRYHCLVAHNAEDGLHLAAQFRPDAILLDMRLPDRSGLSVLQQLKEKPYTRHIPVHVVSAADRTEAAMHLGAVGYATKPTTREQLRVVFRKLEEKFTQKMKRVLLVEDDARQRDSVVQLIGDDDIEINAVESGEEALNLLRTTVFDCMIIDLKLPDMQGRELLQRMSSENIVAFPPAIVYTGRNLTRNEEADLLKYSRSIIIKGARSPERLLDEVTLFLHKVESELSLERQAMLKTARNRDRFFEGRRILLVDDDVRNIFALTSALEQKGVEVEIGRDGFEAISKLNAVADIDLVVMDVMMPGLDGLEATRRIRRDPRFEKLPIIAITAKAMKDDQEQCLKAGASDYLAKPIDLDRLYSLLRVWMPSMERI
jgi:CheY-like chemotaxis protein/CHASE3 domain sensor protein